MHFDDKIYVAGHTGMVGSAIVRTLKKCGYHNLILKTRQELDLLDYSATGKFFNALEPKIVILAAARVGGIQANINNSAGFLYENLQIQNNVIHHAYLSKIQKFCFLGSSCVYPKDSPQPMREEYLLTGPLEKTNEGYSLAKISGLKMIEFYRKQYGFPGISVLPCNLYGTNDSFDPVNSHVLSALVKKFVDAACNNYAQVTVWGSGKARREFMHVDDAAAAIIFLTENYDSPEMINVGVGADISIKELALLIARDSGFTGEILWDTSRNDGMQKKLLDISRLKSLGFDPTISLQSGIRKTICEYRDWKES